MAHKDQRVGIFIDIQNLYHSAKNLYGARVNYKELIKHLVDGRNLIRSIAYVVKTESTLGESSFFEALKQSGLELRTKDLQIYPGGMKKADWDVGMAIDAVRLAGSMDVIILVTGDGDFLPLVDYLRWGFGKEIEVAAFSRTTSGKLKEVADKYTAIEDVPRGLLKSKRARAGRISKKEGGEQQGEGE
ncbi:MAG: NYN domain-containing protein [Patescibacteria group bacterium]